MRYCGIDFCLLKLINQAPIKRSAPDKTKLTNTEILPLAPTHPCLSNLPPPPFILIPVLELESASSILRDLIERISFVYLVFYSVKLLWKSKVTELYKLNFNRPRKLDVYVTFRHTLERGETLCEPITTRFAIRNIHVFKE